MNTLTHHNRTTRASETPRTTGASEGLASGGSGNNNINLLVSSPLVDGEPIFRVGNGLESKPVVQYNTIDDSISLTKGITDDNGNYILNFNGTNSTVSNAINYLSIRNGASGTAPQISVEGEANLDLVLRPKSGGNLIIGSGATDEIVFDCNVVYSPSKDKHVMAYDDTSGTFKIDGTRLTQISDDTAPVLGGRLDPNGINMGFESFQVTRLAPPTETNIDWALGNICYINLSGGNTDISFTNPSPVIAGVGTKVTLLLKQGSGTVGTTVNWVGDPATNIKWQGGVEPTLSVGGSSYDIIDFVFYYNGGVWVGSQRPSYGADGDDSNNVLVRGSDSRLTNASHKVTSSTHLAGNNGESIILVDTSASTGANGPVTISLSSASNESGNKYTIKKIDSDANNVTIDAFITETIDGVTTKVISNQWDTVQVVCDGSEWFII